jgi:DinB superfamily
MKRNILCTTAFVLLGTPCLAVAASGQDVTPQDREKALRYLNESRHGVDEAVKGLSEEQWKFKPAADRWSIAEIVEHLAVAEQTVTENVLSQLGKAPPPAADRDPKAVDMRILTQVPDRSTKFQAPPQLLPTGRWAPTAALEHFLTSRSQTAEILSSTHDLRGHVVNHPALGPLDGYQWILVVAAHSERHTKQILEVKADPHFPAN